MKTIVTFFSNWLTRWQKREPPEDPPAGTTEDANPSELAADLEGVAVSPIQPEVTQHDVPIYQQHYSYSCTAAVLQAVSAYFGQELTHARAIRLTRCKPDGASLEKVAGALRRLHRCAARRLVRAETMRRALRNGAVIIAGDCLTYSDDHAILIFGCTDDYFLVLDPAASSCEWKLDSWISEAGDEFIAVWLKRSRRRL